MTNQSSVPHTEIGLRLTICSEYLLDEQKSVEELYKSWMRRVGGRLIGFTEFEYWYRRFKNNQFDLGYDTSLDEKEISKNQNTINPEASGIKNDSAVIIEKEEPVKVVKRKLEDLKLNYQFKKENVPHVFQNLVNRRSNELRRSKTLRPCIDVNFTENMCTMEVYLDKIYWKKRGNDWIICYPKNDPVTITDDLERSIVDHLWFVLKNLNIELSRLSIVAENHNSQEIDSEKMNTLLQSMFNTFDHQIQTTFAECKGFNEDTFLSMLERAQPGTIEEIHFNILWKEEGKYQRMKVIVETDQWKQAKEISSTGTTPLKVEDFSHCQNFWLEINRITPEDVLRVVEHYFNSVGKKYCRLDSNNESIDIEAIMDVLRSQNDGAIIKGPLPPHFCFKIVKSAKCVVLERGKNCILIQNYSGY